MAKIDWPPIAAAQSERVPSMLDHALSLAARGFRVFPCSPNNKHPLTRKESAPGKKDGGYYLATTDEAQIRQWWSAWPLAMVGVATGEGVGAWVIDLDAGKAGMPVGALLAQLCDRIGRSLPPTWMVETPRGAHLYFKSPATLNGERVHIRNRSGIIKHVDVRGEGAGYVIAPGSIRSGPQAVEEGVDGAAYCWAEHAGPDDVDLACAPDELVDLVVGKQDTPDTVAVDRTTAYADPAEDARRKYAFTALDFETRKVATAPDGQRNDYLNTGSFSLGTLVGAGYLSEQVVSAALEDAALKSGLTSADGIAATRATIRSGLAAGIASPRDMSGVGVANARNDDTRKLGAAAAARIVGQDGASDQPADRSHVAATPFQWVDPDKLPTRQWIYGHQLIRGFVTLTVAPGGVGKSAVTIVEALAMATGRQLLHEKPHHRSRVWMWNGEDPMDELQRRVIGACKYHVIEPSELDGWLFLDSGRDMEIILADLDHNNKAYRTAAVEEIIQTIKDRGIDVVICDPFVSSHRVSENSNGDIDLVVKTWNYIASQTGCAVHLVHHARKPNNSSGKTEVDAARGASALLAAARVGRTIDTMNEAEARKAQVENRYQYLRADYGKANLTVRSDKAYWHQMVSVALGNGPGGGDGDYIGVVAKWRFPEVTTPKISLADVRRVQLAMGDRDFREHEQAAEWCGIFIGQTLGLQVGTFKSQGVDWRTTKQLVREWIDAGYLLVHSGREVRYRKGDTKFARVGRLVTEEEASDDE